MNPLLINPIIVLTLFTAALVVPYFVKRRKKQQVINARAESNLLGSSRRVNVDGTFVID